MQLQSDDIIWDLHSFAVNENGTRDLQQGSEDTKGTCSTKMDSTKDRNSVDLTEAGHEYKKEVVRIYRRIIKRLRPRYSMMVRSLNLQPYVLECNVKWA